jgi:hypothetical protein
MIIANFFIFPLHVYAAFPTSPAIDFEPQTACGNYDGFGDPPDLSCSTYSVMTLLHQNPPPLFCRSTSQIGLSLLINFLMNR